MHTLSREELERKHSARLADVPPRFHARLYGLSSGDPARYWSILLLFCQLYGAGYDEGYQQGSRDGAADSAESSPPEDDLT